SGDDAGTYNRRLRLPALLHQIHGVYPDHRRTALLRRHVDKQVLGANGSTLQCR
ncbi:ATP-dependent RNA helicase dbp7, partial [Clarias magur]